MRSSVLLLIGSLAGIVAGAALIGPVAIGLAIIFDSLCVGVYALLRDDEVRAPSVHQIPTVAQIFDRVRAS
jgi:hypothetical protein